MSEYDNLGLDDDLFATYRVKELDSEDFYTHSFLRIALKATGCSAILFYMPRNATSRAMKNIWNRLSEDLAGVNFYSVNVSRRPKVMEAFQKVTADEEHPLHLYQLRGFPTILTYRESAEEGVSIPQAFYNGELSYDALLNYFITLACLSGHREFPALKEGVIVDDEIIVIDPRGVVDEPVSSLEFVSSDFNIDAATEDAFFSQEIRFEDEFDDEALDFEESRRIPEENLKRYFSSENEGYGTADPGLLDAYDLGKL